MSQQPEIDDRKFIEYSMNPNHPDSQGKWMAFAELGYDVQSLDGRNIAAQDVIAGVAPKFRQRTVYSRQNYYLGF